ncbi:ketol-acid reductoisomerase [candidate division GN15 bacterium]|nr:ketol-acid reductoisomerase [candidate division GN15 bacterium]
MSSSRARLTISTVVSSEFLVIAAMNARVGKCQLTIYIVTMCALSKSKPTIAMLGYGSQGRALALNLKDSGYEVIVGLPSGSATREIAASDGMMNLQTTDEAAAGAEVICFAVPDHRHAAVWRDQVGPSAKSGSALWFLHGLSVHFEQVLPPDDVDVFMIAPHAPGLAVREQYLGDRSLSAFVAVHQDVSGRAMKQAQRLAEGIGISPTRLVKTTFEHEAVGDLFGEQAVLCGGMSALITAGFETLVARGLAPENAYLEVAYQLDLIISLVKRYGIEGMLRRISVAARLGAVQAGPKLIDARVRETMQRILQRIDSGEFARELQDLDNAALADLDKSLGRLSNDELERAARKFRS